MDRSSIFQPVSIGWRIPIVEERLRKSEGAVVLEMVTTPKVTNACFRVIEVEEVELSANVQRMDLRDHTEEKELQNLSDRDGSICTANIIIEGPQVQIVVHTAASVSLVNEIMFRSYFTKITLGKLKIERQKFGVADSSVARKCMDILVPKWSKWIKTTIHQISGRKAVEKELMIKHGFAFDGNVDLQTSVNHSSLGFKIYRKSTFADTVIPYASV